MATLMQSDARDVGRALGAILSLDVLADPETYIAGVLGAICAHLGYDSGVALLATPAGDTPCAVHGVAPSQMDAVRALAGDMTRSPSREALVYAHPIHDAPPTWGSLCHMLDARHVVYLPFCHADQRLGACLLFDRQRDEPSAGTLQALHTGADMAAMAVASNRHLDVIHERAVELRTEVARRRTMEESLREALKQRRELEEIVKRSPMVVLLCRVAPEWPVTFVSSNITQFGYTPESLHDGSVRLVDLVHAGDREWIVGELGRFAAGQQEELQLECRVTTRSGETRWVEGRFWVRQDEDTSDWPLAAGPSHIQGMLHDITQRKRAEETMAHQAFHDALTGLPNRLLFHDRLGAAISRARRRGNRLAVMFLDLDNFKAVNDTLGHASGDQLLRGVADRLTGCLREEDTVARWGGDEFTILLPEVSNVGAAAFVAERVLETLAPPMTLGGYELHVTGSLGISLFPDDGPDADSVMRSADTALYQAKDSGRNTYQFYHPGLNARTLELLQLEGDLRYAVERGQLLLHYQPRVSLETGTVLGVEALVRWQHPTLGLIPPSQFIPMADETGLIEPIGAWVLHEACMQTKAWHDEGFFPLSIAVNLSGRQFQHHYLPDTVAAVLEATGLAPEFLELEITESVAMRNVEISTSMMRTLRGQGVKLALDDFGVGYSSLISLKQFPISTLKIDRHFVRGIAEDPVDAAIVEAVVSMGRSLRLHVVAEGVETEGQLAVLRTCRCDGMQGFLFCRPVTADAVRPLLPRMVSGDVGSSPA